MSDCHRSVRNPEKSLCVDINGFVTATEIPSNRISSIYENKERSITRTLIRDVLNTHNLIIHETMEAEGNSGLSWDDFYETMEREEYYLEETKKILLMVHPRGKLRISPVWVKVIILIHSQLCFWSEIKWAEEN